MGLANIVVLFVLYRWGIREAATVSFVRLVLAMLLFGNPVMLIYSTAGAFLSLLVMAILKKLTKFSMVFISISGAIFHNLGQILTAMLLLQTKELGYYMIVLGFTGTVSGIFVGLCGAFLFQRFKKIGGKS